MGQETDFPLTGRVEDLEADSRSCSYMKLDEIGGCEGIGKLTMSWTSGTIRLTVGTIPPHLTTKTINFE